MKWVIVKKRRSGPDSGRTFRYFHVLHFNFEDKGKFFRYVDDQITEWYNFPVLYKRKGRDRSELSNY
ncbi:hypothetical protein J2Z37_000907 [Ammoniphilus resinae]|uniref:Transposase n=1 Tax=Ammoniphilus resinae TaxID=861532 RepID=A0ABS4GLY5_9BACL|nr:hypothetical protein [Ammoniphilus resinae]